MGQVCQQLLGCTKDEQRLRKRRIRVETRWAFRGFLDQSGGAFAAANLSAAVIGLVASGALALTLAVQMQQICAESFAGVASCDIGRAVKKK